jgi:HEAT repeat protein
MGAEAEPAISALTENLYYDGPYRVRKAAATALGDIGEPSKPAVPVLIAVLLTDFVHVQCSAAWALGEIGDTSAIPALAIALQDDDMDTRIEAAEALALLAQQDFPDIDRGVYVLNEEGEALLVVAARKWWNDEGRNHTWGLEP